MKPDELRELINNHLEQNEYTKSLEYSQELMKAHPADLVFEDHSKAGYCYLMLDQEEDAAGCYSEALKLKPDDAMALANRGGSLFNLGRMEEAFSDFRQALSLKPDLFIPWHYISLHHLRKYLETGDPDSLQKMVNAYRRILVMVPDYSSFPVRSYHSDVAERLDEFVLKHKDLPELSLEEIITV